MGRSLVGVVGRLWLACVGVDLYLSGDRKQDRQEMKYDLNSLIPFLLCYSPTCFLPHPDLPSRAIDPLPRVLRSSHLISMIYL